MAGKGDTPRPCDFKKYQENYELIFGKKDDTVIKQDESCNIQPTTEQSED